jgi:AraC-like DNA-binding protein
MGESADNESGWRDLVAAIFDSDAPNNLAQVGTALAIYPIGPLLLGSLRSVIRSARSSGPPAPGDQYLVQVHRRAGRLQNAAVTAGDLTLSDLTAIKPSPSTAYFNVALLLPRAILNPLLTDGVGGAGTLVLSGDSGLGRLLAGFLELLYARAEELSGNEGVAIAQATASLVAACFGPAVLARDPSAPKRRHPSLVNMKRYIEENLDSADLSPEELARKFHLSRANLYRLFEPYGGVAIYIRDQRLQRAFIELVDSEASHRRVADIAYTWGFASEAAFSRAFKRAFDMTPREARSAAQASRAADSKETIKRKRA